MIFSIDHIVFAATAVEAAGLTQRLKGAGFVEEHFRLEFPEIGAHSDSLSFAGGGFVEFVAASDLDRVPSVWFAQTPRIIGLGFASDNFDADVADWTQADAWTMNEDHVLPTGRTVTIHAAGPHRHHEDFYVFVMDRPDGRLEFPETAAQPRLREIVLAGQEARRWGDNLERWLRLPRDGDTLAVGDVRLRFEVSNQENVHGSLRFASSASGDSSIALAAGSLEVAAGA
jgi:hypothetical protein